MSSVSKEFVGVAHRHPFLIMFKDEFNQCFKTKDNTQFLFSDDPKLIDAAEYAGKFVSHSYKRQYLIEEKDERVLRLSSLGKASIIELLAKKFGLLGKGSAGTVDEQCRLRFVVGDFFESLMYFTLIRYGFEVIKTQETIDWNGVYGHSDFIVKTPEGETCVLELKTANDRYFKQARKSIGDERGYLTQLCTYSESLGLPAYWVFMNKDSQEIFVKGLEEIKEPERKLALARAKKKVEIFNKCEKYEDFPLFCKIPPPSIEKYKSGEYKYHDDGFLKMYIRAFSMPNPELFYIMKEGVTNYGTKRMYVYDYKYPEAYVDRKPDIQTEAMKYD